MTINMMNMMPTKINTVYRKRGRTVFTQDQLLIMQEEFLESPYLSAERRKHLATELNLHEENIKVWFQNRRQKSRNRLGQKCTRTTRKIPQEDADSTVTSPDGQNSKTSLQGSSSDFDQGSSPRQNPYENYGFSDAEINYRRTSSQRRNLKTESGTIGYKELSVSHDMSVRQQNVPSVSMHQNSSQQIGSNVSNMRERIRFNAHPYKRMNPLPAQRSVPHLSTIQSYPAASLLAIPLQNNEATAAYNQNGYGRSQLLQDNWHAQMIPQHQQFNGYCMTTDVPFSQSPSTYKREFIPRSHISANVQFARIQESQPQVHQSFNGQIMTKQAEWSQSSSISRRQPMPQYHSSQYVQQNNNSLYYADSKSLLPEDLSNGNALTHQSFTCKVEGSSLSQRRNLTENSSLPSCSFSNNVPITRKLSRSDHSAFSHYNNSCQFEAPPFRPTSSSSSVSNFPSSSSFQNGMCETPVHFKNDISINKSFQLTQQFSRPSSSSNFATSSFPMSSSTKHGPNGFRKTSMTSQNVQVYQNVPSSSTVNPNASGSSLADLYDQIPHIKNEILEDSANISTTDPYSSMSSVENLCEELMGVQDSKASKSFNDTYFLGGPNNVQRNGVYSRNSLSGSDAPFIKNPNDSNDITHILEEANEFFDKNNACANAYVKSSPSSKSGFNNPPTAYSQVPYHHVVTSTISNVLDNIPLYLDINSNSTHQAVQPVVNASGMNSVDSSRFNNDAQISSTCNPATFLEIQSNEEMAQLIKEVIDTEMHTA